MTPHKHCELIKLWADGAEIECPAEDGSWIVVWPNWRPDVAYRIKRKAVKVRLWRNKTSGDVYPHSGGNPCLSDWTPCSEVIEIEVTEK